MEDKTKEAAPISASTVRDQRDFEFQVVGSRKVVADFTGGQLSSDSGVLLLRDLDRSLGLTRKLAGCFNDRRDPRLIVHTLPELIAQRVLGLALGYQDLNDHQALRKDPLLALAAGKPEMFTADGEAIVLASAPTLNRLEITGQRPDSAYHKIDVRPEQIENLLLQSGV